MTTKAPAPVEEFPATTLEKTAYLSVAGVPAVEPNDMNRLGYHVWRWLSTKQGTLEEAVSASGARLTVPRTQAVALIREALAKLGIQLP